MRFDWDVHNEDHLLRHGVAPWEAEEALADRGRLGIAARRVSGERRWAAIGRAESGRVLVVVFARRRKRVRVVTARPATTGEQRRYRRSRV